MAVYIPPLPVQNFVNKSAPVVGAAWLNAVDAILQGTAVPAVGVYSPTFLSGQVQLAGPNGLMNSFGDFQFGLNVPGPGGSGPSLLIGGATKVFSQIITDAQVNNQAGINLYITAGNTSVTDAGQPGGSLWDFGGASQTGKGGARNVQGGSSANGPGGDVTIFGGNNINNNAAAGNIYMIAGTTGNVGGNVKIYATKLGGTAGGISFWLGQPDIPHSVPLWTMDPGGALFPASQGAGNAADLVNLIPAYALLTGGNLASPSWLLSGLSAQIQLALSGATSTTPTGNFSVTTDGRKVSITANGTLTAVTTGPNDIILSTLPVGLRPSVTTTCVCGNLSNASANGYLGVATISPLGSITITLVILSNAGTSVGALPSNWSALSGTQKGVSAGWSITYPL